MIITIINLICVTETNMCLLLQIVVCPNYLMQIFLACFLTTPILTLNMRYKLQRRTQNFASHQQGCWSRHK